MRVYVSWPPRTTPLTNIVHPAQNSWRSGLVSMNLQHAKVGFVIPRGYSQNMRTGLIPLSSIRYAIATSLPDIQNTSLWSNPCYSSDGTSGMFDYRSEWREAYREAIKNECAYADRMCLNPTVEILSQTFVEFSFPLGDNAISDLHFSSVRQYSLYVYFDISIVDSRDASTTTRLFTQSPIHDLAILRACRSFEGEVSMLDTTKVNLAIGLVGSEDEWDDSIREFRDVTQDTWSPGIDATQSDDELYVTKADSISSAMITLSIRGDGEIFENRAAAVDYSIELEALTSLHFLDESKFRSVLSMIEAEVGTHARPDGARMPPCEPGPDRLRAGRLRHRAGGGRVRVGHRPVQRGPAVVQLRWILLLRDQGRRGARRGHDPVRGAAPLLRIQPIR